MKVKIYISLFIIPVAILVGIAMFQSGPKKQLPPPAETIVVGEEIMERNLEKEKWIEMIHRSAPEDSWRNMDQMYRLNTQSQKKGAKDLPIYGRWREVGSNNQAGRTVYTFYDPAAEEIYTAADGGQIWKGNPANENWTPVNDHFKIPGIRFITRINQTGYSRLLVHSDAWNIAGIFYSDDDGQNWNMAAGLENITSWGFIKRTVLRNNPSYEIYCIAQEWDNVAWKAVSCIYKSTDLGASFEKIHTFDCDIENADIWTSSTYPANVFAIAENEFYLVDDDDNVINISTLPNPENGNTLLTGFNSGFGLFFYAMIRYNNLSHFYASSAGGQNWTEKGSLDQGPFMVNSFAASTDQKDVLYFGGMEAFRSTNAGQTWTLVNGWGQYYGSPEDKLHADIPSFNSYMPEPGNEILFINTDGGTYISYDKMENVENISLHSLRISQYYSTYTCRFDPSFTHAGSQDQGYQKSVEGMNNEAINYDQVISGDYGNLVSGDDGASIWMVYPGFAMYGPNINNSNNLILEDFVGSDYQWLPKLMEDPFNPENAYLAGGHITEGTHLIKLERNGGNIDYSELPYDFGNGTATSISAMACSNINNNYWYVLTAEKDFFYSTDAGNNWTETPGFNGPGSHYFYGATIAPANNTLGLLYIGGSGYSNPGVFRSTDNGQSFIPFATGLPNTMVFQIVLSSDDSLLFAATEVGAFVCKTFENQWYPLTDSVIPDQSFWAVDFIDTLKLARFATYGRGIWDFELDPDVIADFVANSTSITTGDAVSFSDQSLYSPVSWEWYFEGGDPETSSDQNPAGITYNEPGTFDVRLIAANDHSTDTLLKSDYITVGITGIAKNQEINNMTLYPNPVSRILYFDTRTKWDRVVIYDAAGKISTVKVISDADLANNRLDVSSLKEGIYFLQLVAGKDTKTFKIIKKNR